MGKKKARISGLFSLAELKIVLVGCGMENAALHVKLLLREEIFLIVSWYCDVVAVTFRVIKGWRPPLILGHLLPVLRGLDKRCFLVNLFKEGVNCMYSSRLRLIT